jgi:hypothetical protein
MISEKLFHLGEDSTIINEAGQPIMQIDVKVLACLPLCWHDSYMEGSLPLYACMRRLLAERMVML